MLLTSAGRRLAALPVVRLAAFVLSFCCAAPAAAESKPSLLADHGRDAVGAIAAELGYYTESGDSEVGGYELYVATLTLDARYAPLAWLAVELEAPLVFADLTFDAPLPYDDPAVFPVDATRSASSLRSGNPFLAAYYVQRGARWYARAGLGVALPLARSEPVEPSAFGDRFGSEVASIDAHLANLTLRHGGARRGQWDPWLYAADTVTLAAPAQIETQLGSLVLGADAAAALMLPEDRDASVAVQLGGAFGGRLAGFLFGTRLQYVYAGTLDGSALALVPLVQWDFDKGHVHVRGVYNLLDSPVVGPGEGRLALFAGGGVLF